MFEKFTKNSESEQVQLLLLESLAKLLAILSLKLPVDRATLSAVTQFHKPLSYIQRTYFLLYMVESITLSSDVRSSGAVLIFIGNMYLLLKY